MKSKVAVVLTFLASLLVAPQATAQSLPADKIERIEAAITELMARKSIPGLSIAVVVDNELRWQRGYGMADVENFVPAKASTVYRIASVSKPITATAVLQLAERGKLDLDAPVQRYAPAFPAKEWTITPRQLLGHLSGIRNYRRNEFPNAADNTRFYESLTDALSLFKDDPLDFEPGAQYSYTTYGYVLLGVVIEGASGMSYTDYVRENVFKPAKMAHTRADSVYDIIPNRARGYGKTETLELRNAALMDTSYKIPAGGLVSTAEDLASFAIAVQNGVLVKKETFVEMCKPQKTRDGAITSTPFGSYGLGWYLDHGDRKGVVWHGGVQQGVTSTLSIRPGDRLAVAILTNKEGGEGLGLTDLADQIADILHP